MIEFTVDRHGFIVGRSKDFEFTINPIGPTLIMDGWLSIEDLEQILAKMKELQNSDTDDDLNLFEYTNPNA